MTDRMYISFTDEQKQAIKDEIDKTPMMIWWNDLKAKFSEREWRKCPICGSTPYIEGFHMVHGQPKVVLGCGCDTIPTNADTLDSIETEWNGWCKSQEYYE